MEPNNYEQDGRIVRVKIEDIMQSSYIDYSMSVIVSRALPDVRDGLKPVHRRVLFGMNEMGISSTTAYKKSARIVGDVMGKYHPHGDSSVYDTMVRMAQWWSLRYMLVEGQGNYGSRDGDAVAAMRYTEARLRKMAEAMLEDIDKETVDFRPNFDESLKEPVVLPAKVPMLLINGAAGIAVGMATNMAPHNIGEVVDATIAWINNNDITVDELMHYIKGPDFPTGSIICGSQGIRQAYETGKGRVIMRARTEIEVSDSGRETIVVTELPYMVGPASIVSKIDELVKEDKLQGVSYTNDESDRNSQTRVVVKLKKDAVADVVLNHLFKHTDLQSSFSINNIALVNGRPLLLTLKDLIRYFVEHRQEVVVRRAKFNLRKAQERLHILEGLLIAVDNIDEVIALIRSSTSPEEAYQKLIARFGLSELQAKAIGDMRIIQLQRLGREKLQTEFDELTAIVARLTEFLANRDMQMQCIKDELAEVKSRFGDPRLTEIQLDAEEFNPEDFYANDDMVITISHLGYIKRTPLSDYRTQTRGGKGSKGAATRDEDFIEHIFVAKMHNTMLFFTENGRCHWLKVYDIPEGERNSKGRAIQNVIRLEPTDKVKAYINVPTLTDKEYVDNHYILMCTKNGTVKKTVLAEYSHQRTNGVNAITIREGDQLLEARLTDGKNEVILAVRSGKAVHFNESTVRSIGRTGSGVRGMSLGAGDEVIGMICIDDPSRDILVVSENGYGKRSKLDDYRITHRGGKGVKTLSVTDRTGALIAIKDVTDNNDLMIINKSGLTIRLAAASVRTAGRVTQGVRLIHLRDKDSIAAVAAVEKTEENEATEAIETAETTTVETDNSIT